MMRPRKSKSGTPRWLKYTGLPTDWLKKPDTYTQRHNERGLFTWLWVTCEYAVVKIVPVLNPVLGHNRRSLTVYQQLVNRVVYRKPHYKMQMHNNGISRDGGEGENFTGSKNFCTCCVDVVVNALHKPVRITKGVYLPIEHQCNSVRVYNLHGKLLEVKQL